MVKQVKNINKVHKILITDFFKIVNKQPNKNIINNIKDKKNESDIEDESNNNETNNNNKDDMSNDEYKLNKCDNIFNDDYKNDIEWHCLICDANLGYNNPRQLCRKYYCEYDFYNY